MPSLGADMQYGTLRQWRIRPGDTVQAGDVVAIVETEKGLFEVDIAGAGVVDRLLVQENTRVPVGTVLARLAGVEEQAREAGPATPEAEAPRPKPLAAVPGPAASSPEIGAPSPETAAPIPEATAEHDAGAHVRASPAARRAAQERGVDLVRLPGSGPNGVITLADVERAAGTTGSTEHVRRVSPLARRVAEQLGIDVDKVVGTGDGGSVTRADVERAAAVSAAAATGRAYPPGEEAPATAKATEADRTAADAIEERAAAPEVVSPFDPAAMRRAIAAAVSRAKREIPHYYVATDIDMATAMQWLKDANLDRPVTRRMLPAVLLIKAVALALREFGDLNGSWVDDAFQPATGIDVGIAVSLRGGGLIVPAIADADAKPLDTLMRDLNDIVARARSGGLRASDLTRGTVTVTNLGDQGVESVFGIIYPPQVALVGFGRISERPWARDGMVGVHPVVTATLAADHRASDGMRGSLFLARIDRLLQEPGKL